MKPFEYIKSKYISSALITAVAYAIFGAMWIYFSDTVLSVLVADKETFGKLAVYKGWLYVLFTSILLYFLSDFLNRELKQSERSLYESLRNAEEINIELQVANTELEEKIQQLSENEIKLEENEERFKLAIQGVQDCIWDWNLETNKIWYPKTKGLLGYSQEELGDTYEVFEQLIHPDDLVKVVRKHSEFIAGIVDKYDIEYRLLNKRGKYQWTSSKAQGIRNEAGEGTRLVGSHVDIDERKKQEDKVHILAYGDLLTGLPNKGGLELAFREITQENPTSILGLIYFDLDNFKMINDSFGHEFGDLLLKGVGARISSSLNKSGVVARTGGDEFAIIIRDIIWKRDLSARVNEIMEQFIAPYKVDGREIYVTPSVGVTVYPENGLDMQMLMKCADMAMYCAKGMGKNNFQFYDEEMQNKVLKKAELEYSLRKAVEAGEFELYYQPIIDLKKGTIHAFEALIRWIRSDGEIISPLEFIPLSEETGIIHPLGDIIIEKACLALEQLREKGYEYLGIGVNFSVEQFAKRDLLEKVLGCIDKKNLRRSSFIMEITESIAMEDGKNRLEMLHRFADAGIPIAMDDFGTGYSSMSYLKILPLNCVKIDKSFTQDVVENKNDQAILEAIKVMSKGFGFYTLAEGVESMEQLQVITEKGCRFAQGYFFSRPVPLEQVFSILKKENEFTALVMKAKERNHIQEEKAQCEKFEKLEESSSEKLYN